MQNHHLVLLFLLLSITATAIATLQCTNCGNNPVPYPLSSSPNCGDKFYKVRCTKGALWFDAFNGSSYLITSISPENHRLIVRPQGFVWNTCIKEDVQAGGIWLNDTLPFTITNRNTILKMNCSNVTLSPMDCGPKSPCFAYIKGSEEASGRCSDTSSCCSYTTGGSKTAYRIDITEDDCTAYQSFVDLNASLPVEKWPQPAVEIKWDIPREPFCISTTCCSGLGNSTCLPDPDKAGHKRCFCISGFQWNPDDGICEKHKDDDSKAWMATRLKIHGR